jgi:hypothetical protein
LSRWLLRLRPVRLGDAEPLDLLGPGVAAIDLPGAGEVLLENLDHVRGEPEERQALDLDCEVPAVPVHDES